MSCVFSTLNPTPISCDQPVLTVSFPKAAAGANTVVLANGAVVDLNQLGALIAQVCPAIACQPSVVQQSAAGTVLNTSNLQSLGTVQGLGTVQTAASFSPDLNLMSMVQQSFSPDQMAILGQMLAQNGWQ